MSGDVEFNREKCEGLAQYIVDDAGLMPAEKLAWIMFHSDFGAYAKFGRSITGATYVKREVYPEIQEMGDGWFARFIRSQIPWYARLGGWCLTALAIARAGRA